jgi:hypothetical protein
MLFRNRPVFVDYCGRLDARTVLLHVVIIDNANVPTYHIDHFSHYDIK